jgi:hypothetical protein
MTSRPGKRQSGKIRSEDHYLLVIVKRTGEVVGPGATSRDLPVITIAGSCVALGILSIAVNR